ncbi:MAG: lipoprotein [Prevotellaceae bacterium]|jgi:hypothetical protein|nr:lipoprotein [Prevotellaceae bacterium]
MKKLIYLITFALIVAACSKDEECYECKNADNQVMQTYCDVSSAEANSKAVLWTNTELIRLSQSVMSDATRRAEIRRLTITHCDRK